MFRLLVVPFLQRPSGEHWRISCFRSSSAFLFHLSNLSEEVTVTQKDFLPEVWPPTAEGTAVFMGAIIFSTPKLL